jgi:H+-transporting ATPase
MILGILFFNAIIGFVQEQRAAKTVTALKERLQVLVRVLRGGNWQQIPSKELVPGDLVRIRTGDFLTADMQIREGKLIIDTSALTGESATREINEDGELFAGSIVKNGECTAIVSKTGLQTYLGKTTRLVFSASHKLHMEEVVGKVVKSLFLLILAVLIITVFIAILWGQPLISVLPLVFILLISVVPAGLSTMFTISMANGSRELSAKGLLVSRLTATEDAATLTTLCVDKTGTITRNLLSLREVIANTGFTPHDVLLYGSLASEKADNDPIDLAFLLEASKQEIHTGEYQQVSFKPFLAENKRTEGLIQYNGEEFLVMKGAYLTIKEICGLNKISFDANVDHWAQKGFKTIAVGIQRNNETKLVGIVALYDPPRPDASEIIAAIKDLGVEIKMLTGDGLPVAKEIARQTGVGDKVISISDVRQGMQLHDDSFINAVHQHNGFAEVLPEDKFNIVKALQNERQVVGMTGDGVNDAPALKQAEVGIAVKSATDVAKQAASIILLEEGLKNIPELIITGRMIHVRITNYIVNKIAKTIQTGLFVCVTYLITRQFAIGPLDMVLMLFLIDFLILALATDKVKWSKQPANWNINPLVANGLILGLVLFIECLAWFFVAEKYFNIRNPEELHSLGFASLFFSGIFSVVIIRSKGRFFKEPIGNIVLAVIIADAFIVSVLLAIGFPGFQKISIPLILSTISCFMVFNFLINDSIKIFLSNKAGQKNHNRI